MQITGKLKLDPQVLATGKTRIRIIRRHSQQLAICARAYVPHLENSTRRKANQLDQLLVDDPNYWIRRKGKISEAHKLESLLEHAREIAQTQNNYPEIKKILQDTIKQIDSSLVLTRQDKGWAILNVSKSTILPYLKSIRNTGVRINTSVWGPHISVIRGELSHWEASQMHMLDGMKFEVEIGDTIRKNRSGYHWLTVKSRRLENLRSELDLPPRPSPPFHLTIGKGC